MFEVTGWFEEPGGLWNNDIGKMCKLVTYLNVGNIDSLVNKSVKIIKIKKTRTLTANDITQNGRFSCE